MRSKFFEKSNPAILYVTGILSPYLSFSGGKYSYYYE